MDLPEDFARSASFSVLLAALELLDPESETYTYDIISMVEATLEDSASGLACAGALKQKMPPWPRESRWRGVRGAALIASRRLRIRAPA